MTSSDRIPTNLRMLLILEVLGASDQAMTATQINASLGLPKQTVHRLCTTLEQNGFIIRQGRSNRYQIARRLRRLGAGLLHNSRDHMLRRQILLDVASQVGETVNYVIPKDDGMSYLDRVETGWAFQIQLPIGASVPFHCTASGKCFLASLPPKKRRDFVSTLDLKRMTAATRTKPEVFLDELNDIAKQKYALDQEEFFDGMVAIAVPITDLEGRFIAALAFHGPTQRLSIPKAIAQKDVLHNAAEKLRNVLFPADNFSQGDRIWS